MRMMSFALTERQLMDGSKTVTRRTGWKNLRPGERLLAVRKAMGLKAGVRAQPLCEIEVVSVRRESLDSITNDDCAREGFPHFLAADFVDMFCEEMHVDPTHEVTRIEFRKVPGSERANTQTTLAIS